MSGSCNEDYYYVHRRSDLFFSVLSTLYKISIALLIGLRIGSEMNEDFFYELFSSWMHSVDSDNVRYVPSVTPVLPVGHTKDYLLLNVVLPSCDKVASN